MLRLSYDDYAAIRAHGEETYPNECCGILLGKADDGGANEVRATMRAGNTRVDSAHNRYHISPIELIQAQRVGRSRGWILSGFITRIRIIRRSGLRLTLRRRTGSAARM